MLNILLSPKVAIFHNDSFGVDLLKIAVTKAVPKNKILSVTFVFTCFCKALTNYLHRDS